MQTVAPLGYRFKPKDEELVKYFLEKRVRGEPLPWNYIMECDLYGNTAPWEMFDDKSNDQKIWYCFTRLKKNSKKRVSRIAGNGTWHGDKSGVEILDTQTNNVIAVKKTLSFKIKGATATTKLVSWIMHEFSLVGEESCDIVLCKVKKKTNDNNLRAKEVTSEINLNEKKEVIICHPQSTKEEEWQLMFDD